MPPGEVRELYGDVEVSGFEVLAISDEGAAATNIVVSITTSDGSTAPHTVRLIREDEDGAPVPVGIPNGNWRIVHIIRLRED